MPPRGAYARVVREHARPCPRTQRVAGARARTRGFGFGRGISSLDAPPELRSNSMASASRLRSGVRPSPSVHRGVRRPTRDGAGRPARRVRTGDLDRILVARVALVHLGLFRFLSAENAIPSSNTWCTATGRTELERSPHNQDTNTRVKTRMTRDDHELTPQPATERRVTQAHVECNIASPHIASTCTDLRLATRRRQPPAAQINVLGGAHRHNPYSDPTAQHAHIHTHTSSSRPTARYHAQPRRSRE